MMAVFTWGTIKDWNGDDLNDTLNGLIKDRQEAMDAYDSIGDIDVESGWEGEGADAAEDALEELKDLSSNYRDLLGDLLTATASMQDGVNGVKKLVDDAKALAEEHHLTIMDDGSVHVNFSEGYEAWRAASGSLFSGFNDLLAAVTTVQMRCADLVGQALKKAAEVDANYVKAMNDILRDYARFRDFGTDPISGLPLLPEPGASSEIVAQWWYSLTDRERDAIRTKAIEDIKAGRVSEYERLGNLNGIDASTRSVINKVRVDRDLESLRKEGLKEGDKKFDELLGIKQVMNERPDVGLYLYEPPSQEAGHKFTHAAYAVGDVDKAAHVATYVPGMTTTVADSLGNVDQMHDLRARAEAEGKGDVAAIAWVGYDAPPDPRSGDISVLSTHDAKLGGNSLAKHLEGIEDSRNASGQPVHQSVLGHSYGSTTSSYGVAQVRPGVVDDYAVFGSPGVKDTAQAMQVPEGHSYAMLYKAKLGALSSGDMITPFNLLKKAAPFGDTAALGKNPMDPDSGFKIMDPGASGTRSPKAAHSGYLRENSIAQGNLARVVVGTAG